MSKSKMMEGEELIPKECKKLGKMTVGEVEKICDIRIVYRGNVPSLSTGELRRRGGEFILPRNNPDKNDLIGVDKYLVIRAKSFDNYMNFVDLKYSGKQPN